MKNNAIIFDIQKINKTYHDGQTEQLKVLHDFSLQIKENEFVSIVGPSGCGKSTLLRLMAGLDQVDTGKILFREKSHNKPNANIGMVFQSYSLMPWLTVEDNIGLGLKFKKVSKDQKIKTIEKYLKLIGLTKFRKAYPRQLSGGMQQRVAIARSLANDPEVILMDEPFGALDAYTRIQLQKELLRIWEEEKKTIVFVTHSVDEAIYLSDRIILLRKDSGKIYREVSVDIPRVRERSDLRYAQLNEQLLLDFEHLHKEKKDITEKQ